MNVYVRALASALARAGVAVDVLTRPSTPSSRRSSSSSPASESCTSTAGPAAPRSRAASCPISSTPFSDAGRAELDGAATDYDVLHANYWVSGVVGHRLKHELDLPLVTTFHTLDRVKAEVGLDDEVPLRPGSRPRSCACADLVVASTDEEREQLVRYYGADPDRIEIVPQGVDHHVFSPGDRPRPAARSVSTPTACCCSSAASNRSRASTSRSGRSPSSHDAARDAPRRRRTERPRR